MRFLVPLFVSLAVAAFHTALSASLESAEKEEIIVQQEDGLTALQKRDQIEFEAAQMNEASQVNVTEEQDARYLEAAKGETVKEHAEAENDNTEGAGNSAAVAHEESDSESSEEADGVRQRREHHEANAVYEASEDPDKQDILE
ncbi:hypothetical protein LDENG_00278230 [Lucifuga dentata]|nr:hypothetical protein LDENG_00278230 [Lucifuga dentata]